MSWQLWVRNSAHLAVGCPALTPSTGSASVQTAFGICVGFAFNLIFKDMGPLAWRFQLSCAFAPAVPLAALIYLCPEVRLAQRLVGSLDSPLML